MNIGDIILRVLFSIPQTTEGEAENLLKGLKGRGDNSYGTKLMNWLLSNPEAFPEPLIITSVDHPTDRGVDLLIEGGRSGFRVYFQIKTDNDFRVKNGQETFTGKLKSQMAEARLSWEPALYIIILACRPAKHRNTYLHIVNQIKRSHDPLIKIFIPEQAAGLLKAFHAPFPIVESGQKTWVDFFSGAGQQALTPLYLDWTDLTPDLRFQPPQEYKQILESLETNPITILVGPPAIGKTFIALQLLWEAYQKGQEILWITPLKYQITEGSIVDIKSFPGMPERIRHYTNRLGRNRRPIDASEFIAEHLEPGRIVYIEDPFGKLDDEFNYSLHTYDFFNLNRFRADIKEGTPRSSCRVLLTSREHIFERWLADCEAKGKSHAEFSVIHIGMDSYSTEQRQTLIKKLLSAHKVSNLEEMGHLLDDYVDVPFCAELIIRELDLGATIEQAYNVAEGFRGNYLDRLRDRLTADSDSERLFLLLLTIESKPNFYTVFEEMFKILDIDGDMRGELQKAMKRYRPFISRDRALVPGKGVLFVEEDSETAFHLTPVHSTVTDAIAEHLKSTSENWLLEVASVLGSRTVEVSRPSVFLNDTAQPYVASVLLKLGLAEVPGKAQEGIITTLLYPPDEYSSNMSEVMFVWNSLPQKFKERVWQYGRNQVDIEFSRACYLLNFLDIPQEEAWEFLKILSTDRMMGAIHLFGHPWAYLATHLNEIPRDLRNTLDKKALEEPKLFVRILSGVLVEHWGNLPENWRNTFLDPKILSSQRTQERFLYTLVRHWNKIPQELKTLFHAQTKHEDPVIRTEAGRLALANHEVSPDEMQPLYMATLYDSEISVPLGVMNGLGIGRHDQEFAEALYAKANKSVAAAMLSILISQDRGDSQILWRDNLAQRCISKGEDLSLGILSYHCLEKHIQGEFMGYKLPEFPEGSPEPVKLAWLWKYVNSSGKHPALKIEEIKRLLSSFSADYRDIAIAYLSMQVNHLPPEVGVYLNDLEKESTSDALSIAKGQEQRQSADSNKRSLWNFPTRFPYIQE